MKKSSQYWANRKADFMWEQMEKAEDTAKLMRKVYNVAQKQLEEESNKIFDKYRRDYSLTKSEARRLIEKHGVNFKNIDLALRNSEKSEAKEKILEDIDSAAYASRIKKLQQSQQTIDNLMSYIAKNDISKLSSHLKNTAEDSFLHSIYTTQKQAGFGFSFNSYDPKHVDNLLKVNWSNKHFSKAIWSNHKNLGQTLKEEFLINYLTGGSTNDIAKTIADRFGVEYFKARRLVRTESTFVEAEMEAKGYEECGLEEYEYVAILDSRTSAPCKNHDGKIYKVEDRKAGVNYPPLHVFCRSTTIAHISEEWLDKIDKEFSVADLDFDKWKQKVVDNGYKKEYNDVIIKSGDLKMSNLDLMAKSREFKTTNAVGDNIRFSAKKVQGLEYDIWVQDNTKKMRDTLEMLTTHLSNFKNIPTIAIIKEQKLKGIAGYNYKDDVLYISDKLNSKESVAELLSDGYFAAKDFHDILVHELAHKQHWDSAKRLYKHNKKRYNSVEEAKRDLDVELISYVKKQEGIDFFYTRKVSKNANESWRKKNINELVAEVSVLREKIEDKELLNKVKGVLRWK